MQALAYDMWYYKNGINTNAHLQNVRMVKVSELFYPKSTVIHWNKGIEGPINILKNSPYLSNIETAVVYTNVDYHTPYEGKIVVRTIPKESIIRDNSKAEPNYRFIRSSQKLYVSNFTPIIEEYGNINTKYKYAAQLLLRYIKYKNVMSTVYNNLGKYEGRRDFIYLDIPKNIPTRNELNRYAQNLTKNYLSKLPTYKHLNILDLWMFMNPEWESKSMLSKIKNKENVDLVIGNDTNCVIFNLSYLYYLVSEKLPNNNYKNKIGSYSYSMVNKLLLRIFYRLNGQEVPEEEDILTNDEIKDLLGDDNIEIADIEEVEFEPLNDDDLETEDEEAIDDSKIEEKIDTVTIESTLNKIKREYKRLEDTYITKDKYKDIHEQLDTLIEEKAITKNTYNNLIDTIEEQGYKPSALNPKVSLMEMLDDSTDDYTIPSREKVVDDKIMFNVKDDVTKVKDIRNKYIKEQYDKDITRVIYSLQNAGIVVEDHKVTKTNNILGGTIEHSIQVKSINGGGSNLVKITLPNIGENGIIKKDGNYYVIRHLQTDLPIRKIRYNEVMLSSQYGKISIQKGSKSFDNLGYWLLKRLAKEDLVTDIIPSIKPGEGVAMNVELPKLYNLFSRYIKSFRIGDNKYSFLYSTRFELFKDIDKTALENIENKTNTTIIGVVDNKPILIDKNDNFYILDNNKLTRTENPLDILDINLKEGYIEFAIINVFRQSIPIGVVLAYYLGLEELFKLLEVEYEEISSTRVLPKDGDHYTITFIDKIYSVKRDYGKADLILGGLNKYNGVLKTVDSISLENKNEFGLLSSLLGLKIRHLEELKLLDAMFIDPVTLSVLKMMNEPLTFTGLLIRACELLVDDSYKNPNDIRYSTIQGYERIAGILYNTLVNAVREYKNRTAKNRLALSITPYEVMNRIFEDSTTVSLDDINPVAGIKQTEDVSRTGHGGRSKEGMSKNTRAMDDTWIGVISEATKDSGDVGITAYLSANPNIQDIRGRTEDLDPNTSTWSNLISTSNMLAPFILTDDAKRINFSSIMQTHIIPIKNMKVPYVLTGYETMIAIKSDNRFCITAEDDGIVESVNKNTVIVNYNTLGKKKYKFTNWTTKEESGVCYTHRLVPNVVKGSKVRKEDTLVYNTSFFSPSIFNKNRVIYKQGDLVNVALVEDIETYEDSARISKSLNERLGTKVCKIKSYLLSCEDNIVDLVNVGDIVEPNDVLFTKYDRVISDVQDPKTLEIIKKLNSSSPKAKVSGEVVKIQMYYNCDLEDMSDSIKHYVLEYDKNLLETTGNTGKVDSGYKINGNPLQSGYIELKIYVEITDNMSIGDKAILGNQLKFTVGDIYNHSIEGEDGTPVDILFSMRSIGARIVNSPLLIGTTSMLLDKVGKLACDIYFKE